MIEILDQPTRSGTVDAGRGFELALDRPFDAAGDWSLAAVAYAAFFTEAERDEIGTFDQLPVPEQARWQSVAAHIARTVVSPVDEDLEAWRAEQRRALAEQVREAPYSRELWRAMTRTTDLQQQIASLRDLLAASRASAAAARSHSQRLATSTQALEHPMWWDHQAPARPDGEAEQTSSADGGPGSQPRLDPVAAPDGAVRCGDRVTRRL